MFAKTFMLTSLAFFAGVVPTLASSVMVGNDTGYLTYPFSSTSGSPLHFQQVYANSVFSGPVAITALSLFKGGGEIYPGLGVLNTGDYTITLSTTTRPVNGLGLDLSANLGSDVQLFGAYHLVSFPQNPVPDPYPFQATTPFLYNPAAGNLLLDVQSQNAYFGGSSRNCCYGFQADTSGSLMSSAFVSANEPEQLSRSGLVTQFTFTSVSTTPEPATCWLVFSALVLFLLGRSYIALTGALTMCAEHQGKNRRPKYMVASGRKHADRP